MSELTECDELNALLANDAVPCRLPKNPNDEVVEPVTFKLPNGISTLPFNVCTSDGSSPSMFEPDVKITDDV